MCIHLFCSFIGFSPNYCPCEWTNFFLKKGSFNSLISIAGISKWKYTFLICLDVTENCFGHSKIFELGHEKMCLMSYANNKRRRSACASAQSDQRLCCSLFRYYNISRFYSRNFKTLASFCGCTGWFVSGLVGNSRRHVLSCHGSFVCLLEGRFLGVISEHKLSQWTTKPTKYYVCPVTTQISLHIWAVWSGSSFSTWNKALGLLLLLQSEAKFWSYCMAG